MIFADPHLNMTAVALIDDDPAKVGIHVQGLPVVGQIDDLPQVIERYHIQQIIFAIPSAP